MSRAAGYDSPQNLGNFENGRVFVHGAVGLVELSLDEHPLGDALLTVLWQTAVNGPLTREMEETARRVMVTPV